MTSEAADLGPSPRPSSESRRHPPLRPVDAASLILIDRSGAAPCVLMGRRAKAHVFMPGMYVFPGGRRDPDDSRKPVAAPLRDEVLERLSLRTPKRFTAATASGLAIAAARELEEEVSLSLTPVSDNGAFRPDLSKLRFVARAITPPGRSRRFDTRFFACFTDETEADTSLHRESAELVDLTWAPLADFDHLPVPDITRTILRDVGSALKADPELSFAAPAPFYFSRQGRFLRETL